MEFKENAKPIYLQITDKICDDIMSGVYPPDTRLPSVREFAASVQVNANTVMRSYEHLSNLGVIFNRRGIGFFVASDAIPTIKDLRKEIFYREEIPYFFSRLKLMDVTPEQLYNLFDDYLKTTQQ